jgi:hypothetical protein
VVRRRRGSKCQFANVECLFRLESGSIENLDFSCGGAFRSDGAPLAPNFAGKDWLDSDEQDG